MSQNLINATLSGQSQGRISAALDQLQAELDALAPPAAVKRGERTELGDESEAFGRKSAAVLSEDPGVVPRDFDVNAFRAHLTALDALRPLSRRLAQLHERLEDTLIGLRSDMMVSVLEGYAALKRSGKNSGGDGQQQERAKGPRAATPNGGTPPSTP